MYRFLAFALFQIWQALAQGTHLEEIRDGNAWASAQEAEIEAAAEQLAYTFTEEEEAEMMACAYLEGGHTGVQGICMIYRVIINRVEDPRWPNTIHEVIHQPGQFAVASYLDRAQPNEDCRTALEMIKRGWDESNGAQHFWGDGKQNHFY